MRDREPMTKTVKASDARQHFSQLLNQVFRRETRILVEKSGIPVAAIISAEDLERFNELEAQRREAFKALDASWEAFKDVPWGKIEAEVTEAVTAARRKLRKEATPGANS